jgi:GNAT superfamily N-acetyltransferase
MIIGMAIYYPTFSTWRGKMLYLEDFYVQPKYRSKGIGQSLFDSILHRARITNCKLMKWQVLDWNKKAIKFYKRNNAEIETEWLNGKLIL